MPAPERGRHPATPYRLTADDLRAFRKQHGLSQAALARALGLTKRTVEGWEGTADPRSPPPMLSLALAALEAGLEPV